MADLPSPWREFLEKVDAALPEPVSVHCVGGFAVSFFYGLPRPTGDIDYYKSIPATRDLREIAGRDSQLAKKYKVYFQRVTVTNLPEDYDARLTEMFPGRFKNLRLYVPDPYDLMLSKLERNSGKDRDDAAYLFRTQKLDPKILQERYQKELRPNLGVPNREDLTLKLWLDMFHEGDKK